MYGEPGRFLYPECESGSHSPRHLSWWYPSVTPGIRAGGRTAVSQCGRHRESLAQSKACAYSVGMQLPATAFVILVVIEGLFCRVWKVRDDAYA